MPQYKDASIVVAIPCHNEEITIQKVVLDFKKELPQSKIVVIDNRSTDRSAQLAKDAGATVLQERRQGKGWVIRKIFEEISADIYVLVDGDDTYLASGVHKLIAPVLNGEADMAVGSRLQDREGKAFGMLHMMGNYLFIYLLNRLFRSHFQDILSGYRVFSRKFVETIPLITGGFQTETEMTIQSIEKRMTVTEIPLTYKARPEGSRSKISTFKDGWLILLTIAMYLRDHNPLRFFVYCSFVWILFGEFFFGSGWFVHVNKTEWVLVQGIIFLGALLLAVGGLILSAVNTRFKEMEITNRKLMNNGRFKKKL
ncbi:MAG TPA: glycosyltransferase family 2 protein [Candidatus Omnitrophota bacterium]|mgnify:FL=1|nr:glycosyltransferase [Candidatus Omnitrophota bacterium]HQO58478.1 glycosyltransferase family 2 protein [Candidatus Omnitrophota bacterium]